MESEFKYLLIIVLVILFAGVLTITRGCGEQIDRVSKSAIITYEEYQEIHNTCTKLNEDLCNMKQLPETDKMFEQFSKAQRINTIKTQLNRWVEDYNAKSKMITKSLWKSNSLPYQLSTNQFTCY